MIPRACKAAFTPAGFPSSNNSRHKSASPRCISRASSHLPSRALRTNRTHASGTTFASTEITPSNPTDNKGSVKASSPESSENPSRLPRTRSVAWSKRPEASFTATIFGHSSAKRATVPGHRFTPERPGTLYRHNGNGDTAANSLKCSKSPFWFGLL